MDDNTKILLILNLRNRERWEYRNIEMNNRKHCYSFDSFSILKMSISFKIHLGNTGSFCITNKNNCFIWGNISMKWGILSLLLPSLFLIEDNGLLTKISNITENACQTSKGWYIWDEYKKYDGKITGEILQYITINPKLFEINDEVIKVIYVKFDYTLILTK